MDHVQTPPFTSCVEPGATNGVPYAWYEQLAARRSGTAQVVVFEAAMIAPDGRSLTTGSRSWPGPSSRSPAREGCRTRRPWASRPPGNATVYAE